MRDLGPMKKKTKHPSNSESKPDALDRVDVLEHERAGEPVGEPGVESGAALSDGTEAPPSAAELQERIEKLTDALARTKADSANVQRRAAIERVETRTYANADLMKSLLGVLDDFDRARAAASATGDVVAIVDGVRLVHENLLRALVAHGLNPIDALHQPFDPSVHEALVQQPSDEHPPGTVIEQVARGYRLHDRLLRPAQVVVAKAVAEDATEATDSD